MDKHGSSARWTGDDILELNMVNEWLDAYINHIRAEATMECKSTHCSFIIFSSGPVRQYFYGISQST